MGPLTRLSLLGEVSVSPSNHSAWDEFAAAYGPLILEWAGRRKLRHADAQDLCQLVLLKLVGGLPTYNPTKGRFRAWLKTTVANATTDFVLHAERRRKSVSARHPARRPPATFSPLAVGMAAVASHTWIRHARVPTVKDRLHPRACTPLTRALVTR